MNPTCAIHVFRSRQGQSFGDQGLMMFLDLVR